MQHSYHHRGIIQSVTLLIYTERWVCYFGMYILDLACLWNSLKQSLCSYINVFVYNQVQIISWGCYKVTDERKAMLLIVLIELWNKFGHKIMPKDSTKGEIRGTHQLKKIEYDICEFNQTGSGLKIIPWTLSLSLSPLTIFHVVKLFNLIMINIDFKCLTDLCEHELTPHCLLCWFSLTNLCGDLWSNLLQRSSINNNNEDITAVLIILQKLHY